MYKALGDKLIEITKKHASEISEQWCNAVRTNPRTHEYRSMGQDQCVRYATEFYKNLGMIYYSEKPYTEVSDFFSQYAEKSFKNKISLLQSIYALILMRRHIWLFADVQLIFVTPFDQQQAVECINRTIRLFDHGTYIVIKKYEEMSKLE